MRHVNQDRPGFALQAALRGALLWLLAFGVQAAPLAKGHDKFLGSAWSQPQARGFVQLFNKLTPENAGKWGEIEARRDHMDWRLLDRAYRTAKQHGMRFHFHVLVWGNQQPDWLRTLPPAEQRAEIEEWFGAVAARYPDLDYVEVVNEPLHDPPSKDDAGGGNYLAALGGNGATGWDWVLESFRLARRHFPRAHLLINEYSVTNTSADALRYRHIITLLQREGLVDGIGIQGHAFSTTPEVPLVTQRANLDRLAATGLPIYITEFDLDGPDDATQLAAYQRLFPLFWEHPAVRGMTLWGFRPGLWRGPQGAQLVDAQGNERPALRWLRDYLAARTVPRLTTDSNALDCSAAAAVCVQAVAGALPLIRDGRPARVVSDPGDHPGVRRAAADLQADLIQVGGRAAADATPILAGTLGQSPRIDRLIAARGIDVRVVRGRWEAFLLTVVEQPEPGVERALLIVGSDPRGTIYGLYELSRRIGVSPWAWWADVPVPQQPQLHIAPGRLLDAPTVKYRGIFLNDEEPALGGWVRATFGGFNQAFHARLFPLLLRLKGNLLWPAMWGKAFFDDDPGNAQLASAHGVVIATTHHEPMHRAHIEWQRYGQGPWDYNRNPEVLRQFWRQGIARMGRHESLVTLGMRGDGDEAMTAGTAIDLLERIVTDQRRILTEVTGRPPDATPQVWALYKEVQDYYDAGMQVPDDVTLLFADDNWGNLRRLPLPGAKARRGGYGIYYHFDYVGGPRNYKWLDTVQIERTWEQLQLAHAHGVERMWIVNVGDLKPIELPTQFFLDMAWNPARMDVAALGAYPQQWAAQQFGRAHAEAIAALRTRYAQLAARRKPELLDQHTYSLLHDDESQRVLAEWDALENAVIHLGAQLPPAHQDAWYQLLEYPVRALANLHHLYAALARNQLYAAQGRASATAAAAEVEARFARDAELARAYEQDVAHAKWIHQMAQPRIGYTRWQQPPQNPLPPLLRPALPASARMGVAVAGDPRGWPLAGVDQPGSDAGRAMAQLPTQDPFQTSPGWFEVYNQGSATLSFQIRGAPHWLQVRPAAGELPAADQRITLAVDWSKVPAGTTQATLSVQGSDGTRVDVCVPVFRPAASAPPRAFIESAGRVAIEAARHAQAVSAADVQWQTIPHLGRSSAGVHSVPSSAPPSTPGGAASPRLEYPVHLWHAGDRSLRVLLSPTLDYSGRGGLRFAVSVNDDAPQVLTLKLDPTPGHPDFRAWEQAVSDSVQVATTTLRFARAGTHTLTLWRIDPGLVFQRIELLREDALAAPTYLGPPESIRR